MRNIQTLIIALSCLGLLHGEVSAQETPATSFDSNVKDVETSVSSASTTGVDSASAGQQIPPVQDGFYKVNTHENAKPYAFPKVDKNNVVFFKRIWRDIDLADERNHVFAVPGASLMEAIVEGIKEGKLTAFDPAGTAENPTGDAFTTPMSPVQALGKLSDSVLVPIFDEYGNQIGGEMQLNEFSPESVTKFRIKEDIFLDKQRSRIETRIIGIAPLMKINVGSEQLGETPAFWVYFPQARHILATKEVVAPQRGIQKESIDDIFIQHKFASNIIKESNPGELSIKDYAADSEQESKRIESEINEYKKNFWRYK